MLRAPIGAIVLIVGCAAALVACGGKADTNAGATAPDAQTARGDDEEQEGSKPKFNISDGPDVCFRAVASHLGADAKISELVSFFSVGNEIDPSASEPAGEMRVCKAQYQNPQDPRKLLQVSMDMKTGSFSAPLPVEISVMGGDASSFNLEDHLMSLSQVNAAGLSAVMAQLKPSMNQIYGKHAWSGVRLMSPGSFDPKHMLRLDIDGRLASNDIKENGYVSIAIDGKTIVRNLLKP